MVTIIDAPMGCGKTSFAFNMMSDKKNIDTSFIYVTPYLEQIDRANGKGKYRQEQYKVKGRKLIEPRGLDEHFNVQRKYKDFLRLLNERADIGTTHALFQHCSKDLVELIKRNNYILILDEVMKVVDFVYIKPDDLKMALKAQYLHIDEKTNQVIWDKDDYDGQWADYIYRLCKDNYVFAYGTKVYVWAFPPVLFEAFKEVYILTYMFDAQIQRYYFDLFGVKYQKKTMKNHILCDYEEQKINNKHIHIFYDAALNDAGESQTAFCKSWYNKNKQKLKSIQNNIYNFIRNRQKVKTTDVIWTTFKDYKKQLTGMGYGRGFLACNSRSTNEYQNRHTIAYMVNIYVNPIFKEFFSTRGITIDEDKYALSEMLQFIYRSAVRNGEDVTIYIPSSRMRTILKKWISDDYALRKADKKNIRYDKPF